MKRALIVIGAATVFTAGGMVAYAAIPSSTGTFTACVQKSSGTVKIIDESKSCSNAEQRVTWNQAGQPGTPGTNGTPGANGVSGYEVVQDQGVYAPTDGNSSGIIGQKACPPGKVAVGWFGDASLIRTNGDITSADANNSAIFTSGGISIVNVSFSKRDGSNVAVGERLNWRMSVTCVTVTP